MRPRAIIMLACAALLAIGTIGYVTMAGVIRNHEQAADDTARDRKPVAFVTLAEKTPAKEAALMSALATRPKDAANLARVGNLKLVAGQFPAAIDYYKKSLAIDPASAETWSALGEAYIQTIPSATQQLPPPAKQAFANALARNPGDIRSRYYLAIEKDFTGHHDEAINDLIQMLRKAPRGSFPDEAIRAALRNSVENHFKQVKQAMTDASRVQPAAKPISPRPPMS